MADKTIDAAYVDLIHQWDEYDPQLGQPKDGFTGADHHNVATAKYPVGTVIRLYNSGTTGRAGWCYFTYLQMSATTPTHTLAAKMVVTMAATNPATSNFVMTNDTDDDLASSFLFPRFAVSISAVGPGNFGWFITGGPVVNEFVTALSAGSLYTISDVSAGSKFTITSLAASAAASGSLGLALWTTTSPFIAGYAGTADAA